MALQSVIQRAVNAVAGLLSRTWSAKLGTPNALAETLAYHYPVRDDLVIAWLLHDVGEDTSTILDEVRRRFGDAVAGLVRAASKNDDAMEVAGE